MCVEAAHLVGRLYAASLQSIWMILSKHVREEHAVSAQSKVTFKCH